MKHAASVIEPALMQPARVVGPSAWVGHIPFASWIVAKLRPGILVELGTHTGNSYSAFCQAVQESGLDTKCFAVDTWQGDEHAGHYDPAVFDELAEYHNSHYQGISRLLRMTFDEAVTHFGEGSIDLLHIDGLHTYEAVRHDFETWLPKLSRRGVVLLHDTNVHERGFGVWQLWDELSALYPGLHFEHSHGLGVLLVGQDVPAELQDLLQTCQTDSSTVKSLFACLGQRIAQQFDLTVLNQAVAKRDGDISNLSQAVVQRDGDIANLFQAVAERDAQIVAFQQAIAAFHQAVAERDAQIPAFQQAVAERDAQIAGHVATIQKILHSRSWRLTSPFRYVARLLRGR